LANKVGQVRPWEAIALPACGVSRRDGIKADRGAQS